MTSYAKGTSVSVGKTREEIESLLRRFGCEEYGASNRPGEAVVFFRKEAWRVQMRMKLPSRKEIEAEWYNSRRTRYTTPTEVQALTRLEQREREAWRALLLVLKAKWAALEHGIETFEEAFLAHVVVANGQTVGDVVLPRFRAAIAAKQPLMLGSGS